MQIIQENKCHEGRQLRIRHVSNSCDCTMHFSLYLPPQEKYQALPLLTWLSGLTCNDENFVQKSGMQAYAAQHGLAVLAPDTSPRGTTVANSADWDLGQGAGFYLNALQEPWHRHYQMADYVTEELQTLLKQADFALDFSRQGIFGHSMGGHGALLLGLSNPGIYQSISAFAPIAALSQCPWGEKALKAYIGEDKQLWPQYDAHYLLSELKNAPPILVDQGSRDEFLSMQLNAELLSVAARKSQSKLNLRIQEGYDHSYFFIASFIADHFQFHAEVLADRNETLFSQG